VNLEPINCGINCGMALPLMRFQCSLHLRIRGQLFVAVCVFIKLPKQHVACIRQQVARPSNMLPGNMLPWCKRGFRRKTTHALISIVSVPVSSASLVSKKIIIIRQNVLSSMEVGCNFFIHLLFLFNIFYFYFLTFGFISFSVNH